MVAVAAGCSSPAGRSDAPRKSDVTLPRETDTIEGHVPQAATLETLLRQHHIHSDVVDSLARAMGDVFNPRNLRADQAYRLTLTLDGLFREFQYQINANEFLRVVSRRGHEDGPPEFDVAVVPYPREIVVETAKAEITRERSSLIAAFDAAGESQELPLALADMFSGEIDFNSDLKRGDSASVLFERVRHDGELIGYGDVHAAVLQNAGRRFVGIRFVGADGKAGWYDEQGRSLKRQFLKSPLPFEPHVTSGYSASRLHPIYGGYRAHLGVDYAAPVGTAVVAVAAGTVESADWSGDAGRMVSLRHAGGYETFYLHLSSCAPGIRPGVHVDQGQLIGRVGMTGAATGPHLDYRIKKNGVHVNPMLERSRMPPGEPIAPEAIEAFARERDQALRELKVAAAKKPAAPKNAANAKTTKAPKHS